MAKGALMFNLMAERYARTPISNMEAYEKKLAITRKYLKPDHEVFEFGGGTGSTALLHAPYVKHILSTDYASKMVAIGNRKKAKQGIDNVDFQSADFNSQKLGKEAFDIVLGLNILHLMEDVDQTIAKSWEILKPGGYFITSSVCLNKISGIWGLLIPILSFIGLMPRIKGFNRDDLISKHQQAGFGIVEEYNPEGKPPSVFLVAQKPLY